MDSRRQHLTKTVALYSEMLTRGGSNNRTGEQWLAQKGYWAEQPKIFVLDEWILLRSPCVVESSSGTLDE